MAKSSLKRINYLLDQHMIAETIRAYQQLDTEDLRVLAQSFPNDPIRRQAINEILVARTRKDDA